MLTLSPTDSLSGLAGTASVVTATAFGCVVGSVDSYQEIGTVTLGATSTSIVSAASQYIIYLTFQNTSGSIVSGIQITADGTGGSKQITQFSLPANGSASYDGIHLEVRDGNGYVQYIGSTGPTGTAATIAAGTATGLSAGASPTVSNSGSSSAAVFNFGIPAGATGSTGPPGAVNSVAALDTSVAVAGTTSVTVSRGPLTGDITAPTGSQATTLKNTGPGATGPFGSTSTAPVVTIDAQGRVTGLTSATITPAAIGAPATTRLINTTAPLTGGGDLSADRTLAISASSASAAGSESAAHFNTTNNQWVDVTNYGVSISNSGAANTAAMNILISTTFGASTRFFFPATGANYPFNGAILVTKNNQTFMGAGQITSVLFQDSTTDDLFRISDGVSCPTFMDLGFWSTVTMTSGSVINAGTVSGSGVSQLAVYRCGIAGFGGTWFNGIVMNGTISGISTIISDCQINNFTGWGIGVVGNTTLNSSVAAAVIQNTTMNGGITSTTGAVAGIYIQQAGAIQIIASDVISCTNNLLFSPLGSTAQIVASCYILNSYFDHAFGSCVKIAGAGATVRCKFVQCYFTIGPGSTGYSAVEIAGTGVNEGLSFIGCSFLNTFSNTGTSNGVLITNAYDVQFIDNAISGFTNGIQVTPVATAGVTRVAIIANLIGPGGGLTGNGTGVMLNAGSATYGSIQIVDNNFALTQGSFTANTTNLVDNSTIISGGSKFISNNVGLVDGLQTATANLATVTTTVETVVLQIPIPANSLKVGNAFRYSLYYHPAATSIITVRARIGTAGTSADAAVVTMSATALTETGPVFATGVSGITAIGTSATHMGGGIQVEGIIPAAGTQTASSGTFNSTVPNFISITLQNTTSTTTTVFGGVLDVI